MAGKVLNAPERIENQSLKAFNIHFALKNMQRKKGGEEGKNCQPFFSAIAEFQPLCALQRQESTLTFFFRPATSLHCKLSVTGIVFCIIVLISISFYSSLFFLFFYFLRRLRFIALNCPAAIAIFIRSFALMRFYVFSIIARSHKCETAQHKYAQRTRATFINTLIND